MKRGARFVRVTTPGPPKRRAWRIKCDCGRSDDVVDCDSRGESEAEVARRFELRGWKVGRSSHHTCPTCLTPRPPKVRSILNEVATRPAVEPSIAPPQASEAMMSAAPPPAASREDNRRIHDAIDAAWNVNGDCYSGSASDKSLGETLKVPRAWVAAVREQFFGPDENDATRELVANGAAFEQRVRALEAKGMDLAAEAEALRGEFTRMQKRLGL